MIPTKAFGDDSYRSDCFATWLDKLATTLAMTVYESPSFF
jgi:hypothetical protein